MTEREYLALTALQRLRDARGLMAEAATSLADVNPDGEGIVLDAIAEINPIIDRLSVEVEDSMTED